MRAGEEGSGRLVLGYGQEWERQKLRTHRLLLLGLAGNFLTMAVACLTWASIVTRQLPVVTLMPDDTQVCEQWCPLEGKEWSAVQVRSWITTLVQAAMVQDSRLVEERIATLTTMLAPSLRVEFRRTEDMRKRFSEAAKLQIRGALNDLTIRCGDDDARFFRETTPWYCIAYGRSEYRPAFGPLPDGTPPVFGYFFVKLAIQPGEVALLNPLGLEAIEFLPREAETEKELEVLVAEESL